MGRRRDVIGLIATALVALAAHRPISMLGAPFWIDEAWVADSVHAPLSAMRGLTASTPIGFTFVLRLVPPVGGPERLRVVPLLFAVAIGPLAYALGRELDPTHRAVAIAMGAAGAVLPSGLLRHDLKQYTADGAVAVALVWLGARAERTRARRDVALLTAVAAVTPLISHTTGFVAAAVFGALLLTARGASQRVAALIGGAVSGGGALAAYVAFARRAEGADLLAYWHAYLLPGHETTRFFRDRAGDLLHYIGVGPRRVTAALLVAGVVLLWRAGRRATALVLPLLLAVTAAAAAREAYPLWERRTGLFVFAVGTMVAAYAVGRAAAAARRAGPVVLLAGAVCLATTAVPNARSHVPFENVRGFVAQIEAGAVPDDVVLVHEIAAYGFAVYWDADEARFVPSAQRSVRFVPAYDAGSRVRVVMPETVAAALERAWAEGAPRAWLLLAHVTDSLVTRYVTAAASAGTVTTVDANGGVLLLVTRPQVS